ncbi:MAG TPA: sigma-70 family RNA polymerase sigma factor [Minicystis sp.]|nr:sigma-70 family RNA polymerase sigma factor [Minicystis sp.]
MPNLRSNPNPEPTADVARPPDGDDAALLDRYARGDDEALAALLERYEPAVYRFGVKMCKDTEDARDVLQETLLAAARGARAFRGASSVSTWLFSIARSFCIKKRRRRAGEPDAPLSLEAPEAAGVEEALPPPDEAAAGRQSAAALDRAIAALDPGQREVLLLRDVEGLTAPEVAEVLGLGVDAVKSRLHRARVAVRARMAPLITGEEPAPSRGCPEIADVMSRYLEGDIDADACREMEQHVAGCPGCSARCDTLRETLALCRRAAASGDVPPDVRASVRAALRAARRDT